MLLALAALHVSPFVRSAWAQKTKSLPPGQATPSSIQPGGAVPYVTPKGTSVTGTAGPNSYTFTVKNNGTSAGVIYVSPACGGSGISGCTASVGSFSLAAGASRTVTLSYTATAGASGTVELDATNDNSSHSDYGWISVTVPAPTPTYNVAVSSGSVAIEPGGSTYQFTVTNNGNTQATYTLTPSCGSTFSACSAPATVQVQPFGGTAPVTVNFSASTRGTTGAFTLTASYGGYSGSGTLNVSVNNSYGVSVSPHTGTQQITPGTTTTNVDFYVTNTGSSTVTYSFTPACGQLESGGCTVSPASYTLASNATVGISVTADVTQLGSSFPVTFNADDATHGSHDAGTVNVSTATYTVTVNPKGTEIWAEPNAPTSTSFYVSNGGSAPTATYQLSPSCTPSEIGGTSVSACGAQSTVTVDRNQTATVAVSFTAGQPGDSGNVYLTATAAGTSNQGSVKVRVYDRTVVVTPNGQAVNEEPGTYVQSFTIKDIGNVGATYTLTPSCTGVVTCSPSTGSLSLSPNVPATFNVTYSALTRGQSGQLSLTATAGSFSGAGSINVRVNDSYSVSVTPDAGAATPTDGGASANATFMVHNTGTGGTSYNLTPNCTGVSGPCGTNPLKLSLAGGDSGSVQVGYTNGAPNSTGLITLIATDASRPTVKDSGWVTTSVKTYAVDVATSPGSVNYETGASATQIFTVRNNGNTSANYTLTATCSRVATGCPQTRTLTVGANLSAPDTVRYTISMAAGDTGSVRLKATAGTFSSATVDSESVKITVNSHTVVVAPKSADTTVYAGTRSHVFSVKNLGNSPSDYAVDASCATQIPTCQASPQTITALGVGATQPVTVTYTTSGTGGSGTLTLTASSAVSPNVRDSGVVSVTVKPTYTVAVTPKGNTVYGDGDTATVHFALTNSGSATATYGLTATCTGAAAPNGCTTSTVATVSSGSTDTVAVQVPTGPPGDTATINLRATASGDASFTDSASVTFVVTKYAVAVVPQVATATTAAYAAETRRFTVTNTGSATRLFDFQAQCALPVASNCVANPSSQSIAPSASIPVDVSYTTGEPQATGTVRLVARDSGARSLGDSVITLTIGPAIANSMVIVNELNAGTTIERSQCVVVGIVRDVADECGALRIAHPLPAVQTLGTARVPTLLYASDHVQGTMLPVNVILADTATIPTSVWLKLTRTWPGGAQDADSISYTGKDWWSDRSRRIAIPVGATMNHGTGILHYVVEVRGVYSSSSQVLGTVSGDLAFINRTSSPFGGGWWLGGLEQLYLSQYDGSLLWVAGDGSTRRYVNQHAIAGTDTVWLASALTKPDTLLHRADGTYRRLAGNGLYVEFDRFGLHQRTVNRLGYATVFTYDASSRLHTIQLPPIQAGGGPAHTYTFDYDPTSGLLNTVTAPTVDGKTRQVTLARSGTTSRVETITDVLGDSTYRIAFDTQPGLLYAWRSDRRGVRTNFSYESSLPTVARFNTATGIDTVTVEHTFRTAAGMEVTGVSQPLDSAYLRYDAPRPLPTNDVTQFWLDRFGAPIRIVNALGQETRIVRGDQRFPGLVTEARGPAPNYFTTWASYDALGHLVTSTQVNPRDNHKNATTTYAWDSRWDAVTRVTLPGGEATSFGVDPTTGNRIWQEDGRGALSHVQFYYGSDGLLRTIQLPGVSCTVSSRTGCQAIDYDTLGNVQRVTDERDAWTTYDRDAIGRVTLISRGKDAGAHIQEKIDLDAAGRELLHTTTVAQDPSKLVTDAVAKKQYVYVKHAYYRDGADSAVTRWALPDTSSIGTMVTQYLTDGLGRVVKEIAPDGNADLTWFGRSGLVDSAKTRRGYVTRNEFDPLGRILTRSADTVMYPSRQWGVAGVGSGSGSLRPAEIKAAFPRFGDGVVPGIHDTLAYDLAGNLSDANNPDARVHRDYFPNGQLRQETLRIRTIAAGPVDDTHTYVTSYLYDIEGRDSVITHPSQLAARLGTSSSGTTQYAYDRKTGALQSVIDPLGQQVSFAINARGEVAQVTRPGAVAEARTYWLDGTLATQSVSNSTLSQSWRTVSFDYDWRGGLISRHDGARGEGFGAQYSGLGQLLSMVDTTNVSGTSYLTKSSDSVDVYGNAYKSDGLTSQNNYYASSNNYNLSTSGTGGAVRKYQAGTGRLTQTSSQSGTDEYLYDLSGNVEFLGQTGYTGGWTTAQHESRHSYYDAANKLRFADYRTGSAAALSSYRTAFEEYRYDALGRRVLVWSRLACENQTVTIGRAVFDSSNSTPVTADVTPICSASFARRVVWDGDQELWEIQAPSDAAGGALVENDVTPITSGLSLANANAWADPYTQYGITAYTFGLELDRPVGVARANWVGTYGPDGVQRTPQSTPPMAFYPHFLDSGQPYNAAFSDGQTSRCMTTSDGPRCLTPALNFRSDYLPWAQGSYVEAVWLGSLLSDKQDKTLTFYRRNRVYDPLTRQFTQEDPIGLAGGTNVYGFANGDPVSYSDPFGLCKNAKGEAQSEVQCRQQLEAAQDAAIRCPAFQPRGGVTHCNQATLNVATDVGAPTGPFTDADGNALSANDIVANLAKPGSAYREVTMAEAQALANKGEFVVAALGAKGHGHVASLRPNPGGTGQWPLIANVGTFNQVKTMNWVFSTTDRGQVKFYTPK